MSYLDKLFSVTGKTALVTGAATGIGRMVATGLIRAGAHVMIASRKGEDCAKVANELNALGGSGQAEGFAGDVSSEAGIAALVTEVKARTERLHILVNNAGIQHVAPIDDFPIEKWEAVVAIDLMSSFYTIRRALQAMKARKWGRIINVASAHALVASPYKSAYVAAKHGVAGLTKTVALEVAEQGITVNAVCPGYVLTPLVEKQIPDTAKARGITEQQVIKDVLLAAQPTKQFVTVEQGAALCLF
ncbi:MAG: 3-hydroxybutyrate dehydrogenase, partial [Mesorhizobium sp.]